MKKLAADTGIINAKRSTGTSNSETLQNDIRCVINFSEIHVYLYSAGIKGNNFV
jgi:hypothetical protein